LTGWEGAVYQILSHGMVEGALFLLLGVLYDRYASSQINAYGGLAAKLPRTATFFVIGSLAMIGLPMLSNFVGEFLILSSTFAGLSRGWATVATLGVILGAAYMLWLVQRLFYGPPSALAASKLPEDLRLGQLAVLWPLAVLMLTMGVAPSLWLQSIEKGVHPPRSGARLGAPAVALPSVTARLISPLSVRLSSAPRPTALPISPQISSQISSPISSSGEGQR
jgi:NADH-quinone oxidoreductase subunit M